MSWSWPVPNRVPWEIPTGTHPGAFGALRKHDIHTGIDLYAPEGDPVHAVESGVVLKIGNFTGYEAGSDWWNPTRYVLVKGISGVVCYGEVEENENLMPGDEVKKSQRIGTVKQVLKKDKGQPMSMLHLELYEQGFEGEPVWWKLNEQKPEPLRDPTKLLRTAWLKVTDRFHRDTPQPPTDPAERKRLVCWLIEHPLWKHPVTIKQPPGGRRRKMEPVEGSKFFSLEAEGPDWVDYEFMDGSIQECASFIYTYVDPTEERCQGPSIPEGDDRDTDFRVWVETGGWYDQSLDSNVPAPDGGWTQWNKWIGCHDIDLDCGGSTMEECLINLAMKVRWFYGDAGRDQRPDVPGQCRGTFDERGLGKYDPKYRPGCRTAGDGFCKTCGYRMDPECEHHVVQPSKVYPDGSVDGACTECGEAGFPIGDKSYEAFSETPEDRHRCSLRRMVDQGLTYTEALAASLADLPEET